MMMSSVSQQVVINQIHRLEEAPPQAMLRWLIEDAVWSSNSKWISSLVWINKSKVAFYGS
jgi:hypothetical protein